MDSAVSVELFVEILNRYVYYFDQENDAVSQSNLSFAHVFAIADGTFLPKTGYDKVPQWPYRAHPFKPPEHRCDELVREPETTFPEDIGLHCVKRV